MERYQVVRHPGHSGMLLLWIGAGLAVTNWIVAVVTTLVMLARNRCRDTLPTPYTRLPGKLWLVSYRYRIWSEESMLLSTFGKEYQACTAKARRLIPFIY